MSLVDLFDERMQYAQTLLGMALWYEMVGGNFADLADVMARRANVVANEVRR